MVEQIGEIELEEHDQVIYRLNYYYDIIQILGKGGFGIVVEAIDKFKNERLALKVNPFTHLTIDCKQTRVSRVQSSEMRGQDSLETTSSSRSAVQIRNSSPLKQYSLKCITSMAF